MHNAKQDQALTKFREGAVSRPDVSRSNSRSRARIVRPAYPLIHAGFHRRPPDPSLYFPSLS